MPESNISADFWFIQSRTLDVSYEKNFGVVFTQPSDFLANTPYFLIWRTAPGTATIDNANIQISLGTKLTSNCNLRICIRSSIRCQVNEEQWDIDPIPGTHAFSKTLGPCYDLNYFRVLLPKIFGNP